MHNRLAGNQPKHAGKAQVDSQTKAEKRRWPIVSDDKCGLATQTAIKEAKGFN